VVIRPFSSLRATICTNCSLLERMPPGHADGKNCRADDDGPAF
jgi:hypothetical protein